MEGESTVAEAVSVLGGAEQEVAPEVTQNDQGNNVMPYEAREETSISALRRHLAAEAAEEENVKFRADMDAKHPKEPEVGEISAKEVAIQKALKANEDDDETEEKETKDEKETDKTSEEADETEQAKRKILEEPGDVKFKPKEIVFEAAGKEVKLSNDAIIEVPVDGGVKRLHLQELINRASGDVAVQARLAEVQSLRDKERKESIQRNQIYEEKVAAYAKADELYKQVAALTIEGKPEQLLVRCAKIAGKDPKEVVRKFVADTMAWSEKISGMSEHQRDAWLSGLDLSIERMAVDEEKAAIKAEREQAEAAIKSAEFEKFAQKAILDDGATIEEFTEMSTRIREEGLEFKSADLKDRVVEVLEHIHEDRVFKAANQVDPALLNNIPLLQKVYAVTRQLGIKSEEKIKNVIEKITEKENKLEEKRIAENLSRKVRPSTKSEKAKEADDDVGAVSINDYLRRKRF